jgi:hypothetical protein
MEIQQQLEKSVDEKKQAEEKLERLEADFNNLSSQS